MAGRRNASVARRVQCTAAGEKLERTEKSKIL